MGKIPLDLDVSEHQHQACVVRWFNMQYPQFEGLLAAFNNSEYVADPAKKKMVGAKRKALGVVKGMPDLVLFVARGQYHGLFIEMKKLDGKLRAEQKKQHARLIAQNFKVHTAYGWDDARNCIAEYLKMI